MDDDESTMLTRKLVVDELVGRLAERRRAARQHRARERAYLARARAILEEDGAAGRSSAAVAGPEKVEQVDGRQAA